MRVIIENHTEKTSDEYTGAGYIFVRDTLTENDIDKEIVEQILTYIGVNEEAVSTVQVSIRGFATNFKIYHYE